MADPLLLVTTRSRLRSVRFLPLVLAANRRIRRQLASTDGIVRFASLVAGPTEVWSVTVWRSRHAMQEFMRSGEHGRVLWQIGEVLSSFWLLRSRFSSHQIGTWDGMVMPVAPRCTTTPAPAEAALTDEVLAGIPLLREAAGRDGAASYDRSPPLSQERRRVEGAAGALVRVAGPPVRVLHARVALRCLADWLQADEDLLRVVAGFGRRDEVFLLALWRDRAGPDRLLGSPWVHEARKRWGDGLWVAGWLPEHEFGTWDGLRVRALGLHLQRESRPTPPPVSDRPVT